MKALVLSCLLLGAKAAHAFSDPELFAMPVTAGGGGGRYFTGVRGDGYSCSVCHSGATEPKVMVDGLPDKLVTGQRYDLVVHWDHPELPLGLQLELATPSGSHPSVDVLPVADQPAESRCDLVPDGPSAVYTFDVGTRRIVGVADCHAQRVDVSFIANGEPIQLAIGAVRSDSSGTVDGDGTFERRSNLGTKLIAGSGGGCNAVRTGRGLGSLWPLLIAVLVMRLGRRRRHRPQGSSSAARIAISRAQT
jgi:hypothetical protein